jgi:polar amino acid transport system permease protein
MIPRPSSGRDAAKRSDKGRYVPALVSLVSVVVVFGLVALAVGSSPQWPRIQQQFFNPSAVVEAFPAVWRGFWINMRVWVVCLFFTAIWALVLAVARTFTGPWFAPLRIFVIAYVDFFRGVPALLLVLLFGFGIPALKLPGVPTDGIVWGTVAIVLSYSAYVCEVYRSGIDSVHEGQRMAAKALGLTQWQSMRYAILPQALRNVAPAMLNLTMALQKDVALLSVIGVRDAVREAQIFTARTFNYSSLIAAAILFMIATIPLARWADHMTKRDRQKRLQVGL